MCVCVCVCVCVCEFKTGRNIAIRHEKDNNVEVGSMRRKTVSSSILAQTTTNIRLHYAHAHTSHKIKQTKIRRTAATITATETPTAPTATATSSPSVGPRRGMWARVCVVPHGVALETFHLKDSIIGSVTVQVFANKSHKNTHMRMTKKKKKK